MRIRSVGVAFLAAAIALAATAPVAGAQKKQRDVITREEIMGSGQQDLDLLAAIKALRPHFLQAPRGTRSFGGGFTSSVAVYIDKSRQPGVDILSEILASTVQEVRYLDPSRSQNEFGMTANGGAIVIKLYKRSFPSDTLTAKPPG